jgi:serine/threonine protein kinase
VRDVVSSVVDTVEDGHVFSAPATLFAARYVLGSVLGSGGTSTVYRAHDPLLARDIAIKIVDADHGAVERIMREKREMALLATLNHPSLVTLYDAGVAPWDKQIRSYVVMELIDGPTLQARIRSGPIAFDELARMLFNLVDALMIVHHNGIVHQRINPENILLASTRITGREFFPKLAGFGLAPPDDPSAPARTGAVVGEVTYLSPEQLLGQRVSSASDIFSLGLVLLEAATGKREDPDTMLKSLAARQHGKSEIPRALGDEWTSILTSMLARDPAARPTASQLGTRAQSLSSATSSDGVPLSPDSTKASDRSSSRNPLRHQAAPAPRATKSHPSRWQEFRPSRRTIAFMVAGSTAATALLLIVALTMAPSFVPNFSRGQPIRVLTPAPGATVR